jgi:FdhD protein
VADDLSRKIISSPVVSGGGAPFTAVSCEPPPLIYMEDVGATTPRKIAGCMHLKGIAAAGKIFYTTGRLTSEMVIKAWRMGLAILVSRSGFTAWGVELARQANMTLIGRAKGRRFVVLSGHDRLIYDLEPGPGSGEPAHDD